jgi:hypothetical protein
VARDVLMPTRMLDRRRILGIGLACSVCAANGYTSGRTLPNCMFASNGGLEGNDDLPGFAAGIAEQNFGNGFVWVIDDMEKLFDLDFAIGFYDDSPDLPQAKARINSELLKVNGEKPRDGVIAIGRHLVEKLKSETAYFSAALSAICAHECGHILQFKFAETFDQFYKYVDYATAAELHADFICGYYGFHRKQRDQKYEAVLQAKTLYLRGDGEWVSVDHGTYSQRGSAVRAGYLAGKSGLSSAKAVVDEGLKLVSSLGLKLQE